MKPFEDYNHEGNSPAYHSGRLCFYQPCENPAGTAWSPYFCFAHNAERMNRVSAQLDEIMSKFK